MMIRTLFLSLGAAVVLTPAALAGCDSVDTCTQAIVCKTGFTAGPAPTGSPPYTFVCTDNVPAETVLPVCAPLNGNSDWSWDSGKCVRTNKNGTVVKATENIECPAGTTSALPAGMSGPPPACQRPAREDYTAPVFASPGDTAKHRFDLVSRSAAIRMAWCPVGSLEKTGANYYCELYLTAARSTTPTCEKLGGNAWTFDAGAKACTRKAHGETFEQTSNIRCEANATYSAASGKCVTPKGTYYAEPSMIDLP